MASKSFRIQKRPRPYRAPVDPATLPKWDVTPEGPPQLVTGMLSPGAKLVHSGQRRGIKYEVYFEPLSKPILYRRSSPRSHETRVMREGPHYAAVVYYPYYSRDVGRGVEAEQIGMSRTIEGAIAKADAYIESVWKREQDSQRGGLPAMFENPISPPAKTALIIGGVVAGLGLLGYIAVARTKKALVAAINAPAVPVKSSTSTGKTYPYTFQYRGMTVTMDQGVQGGTNGVPPGYFSSNVQFLSTAPGGALDYGDTALSEDQVIAGTKARIDKKLDTGA